MAFENYREIRKQAEAQGWVVTKAKRHWCWRSPSGKQVYASVTPGDRRTRQNLLADLRRAGFVDEKRREQQRHKQGEKP